MPVAARFRLNPASQIGRLGFDKSGLIFTRPNPARSGFGVDRASGPSMSRARAYPGVRSRNAYRQRPRMARLSAPKIQSETRKVRRKSERERELTFMCRDREHSRALDESRELHHTLAVTMQSRIHPSPPAEPERGHPGRSSSPAQKTMELDSLSRMECAAARMAALRFRGALRDIESGPSLPVRRGEGE